MASTATMTDLPLLPTPFDSFPSETSESQLETEKLISSILRRFGKSSSSSAGSSPTSEGRVVELQGSDGGSKEGWEEVEKEDSVEVERIVLEKALHAQFVASQLGELGPAFTPLDASRPWIIFWASNSLDIMKTGMDSSLRKRAIDTLLSFQHPLGGFGGGPSQLPHLAPTYASISALVVLTADLGGVVGEGKDGMERGGEAGAVWRKVDRKGLYEWLLRIKQNDGSFVMHEGGEVDVRGCYCAMVVATILNILTPEIARGTDRFIASCQTYEGGLASASHPFPNSSFLNPSPTAPPKAFEPNPQLGEAHGGYTSCAVLAHFLLQPLASSQPPSSTKTLDVEACLRWAAQMQALPVEGGGFRGRTNKLVDGCYSWWCGGLFPILEALLPPLDLDHDDHDDEEDEPLFARTALQEYTLLCAQAPGGGLRDKPGKYPDGYHSHYNLAGLSTAQNRIKWSPSRVQRAEEGWKSGKQGVGTIRGDGESEGAAEERMKKVYGWAFGWEHSGKSVLGDPENEVTEIHPCFAIAPSKVKKALDFFYGQL